MIRKKKPMRRVWAGVLTLALLLGGCGGAAEADVASGVAFLEALEQQDPAEVDEVLRQRRIAELEARREELLRQIKAGEESPFAAFQDAVILGDSRAVGFFYYGFVDESRDLTGSGDTILSIRNKLDTLQTMQPSYIYLAYGLNDIKIGHWASLDSHIADYMDFVGQIRQRVPGAVIVISSVLPFYDPTVPDPSAPAGSTPKPSSSTLTDADRRRLSQIPQWNELMKAACAENGVIFVDNSAIGKELKDLYESDGIHVMKPFYPHWGKNLAIAALEEGGVAGENSAA